MKEIKQPGDYSFLISPNQERIETIKEDEEFWVVTEDAFSGNLNRQDMMISDTGNTNVNPLTGPLYIEGAEPGDTLKVHILDVLPRRDWAVSALVPGYGHLTGDFNTRILNDPLPETIYMYQLKDGKAIYDDNLTFDIEPFIGTIGTAPALESVASMSVFNHGGNLDCTDTKAGNIIYLPVSVEGANLYLGDCHAAQGHGEITGVAIEMAAKVRLKVEVIKNQTIEWPRIESEEELMVVGAANPLEDASRIANVELIDWMVELGWDQLDAYQALGQAGKLKIGNLVNNIYTITARISKEIAYRPKNK